MRFEGRQAALLRVIAVMLGEEAAAQEPAGVLVRAPQYKTQCPVAGWGKRPSLTPGATLGPGTKRWRAPFGVARRGAHTGCSGLRLAGGREHFPIQEQGPASREMTLRLCPTSL